jgi:Transposase DDE domain
LRAAFFLGRSLNKRQRSALGFMYGKTPCHATLTETLRAIDGRALADALGTVCLVEGKDQRHIAIDGKTMRASKDGEGNATHVLAAFCVGLQSILGNEASRGKGMEIPDALKLLDRLDLKGRIVTGDAMFCQKSIVAKIVEKGGDYVLPASPRRLPLCPPSHNPASNALVVPTPIGF